MKMERVFAVEDMDRVATDVSHKDGGASRDIADEGITLYGESNVMFFLAAIPALEIASVYSPEVHVFQVKFPETSGIGQTVYFNGGQVFCVIQGSDALPCNQASCYICYAGPVVLFHLKISLPALRESAAMTDCTASFVFHRTSAFGTGSDEHRLSVAVIAIAVGFTALFGIFFERLCDRVGTGGDFAAAGPCLLVACDAFELTDNRLGFDIRTERKTDKPADCFCLA